jgi:RHS repeat-associated protein
VYDANGNMTVDKNKNITSIVYNHLNLPTKIIFPTGNIVYFYTASGQKVQKVVTENTTVTTTDYLGGYQYQNTVLQFFPTAEGYVKNTPVSGTNTYSYVFNYTDQLGNVRLSYTKDTTTGSLKILEENNYYPFGLKHNNYNVDNFQPGYKYKFNGKELQDELGLNEYDYGARNYDPALGRWMNIDPLAEHSENITPYHYCSNNPMNRIDPTGMCDDPNCTHGAIRRGWDAVGRFFGAWGYSDSNTTSKQENVKAGPIQEINPQSSEEQENYAQDIRNLNDNFGGIIEGMIHFIALTAGGSAGEASETSTVVNESITVEEKMQAAATKAAETVGEGSGAVHGTKVHAEFGKLAGEIEGASIEVSYKNGQVVPYGTKGSVRADAVIGDVNAPNAVYDLKTGGAKLTPANVAKYNQHVPGAPPVYQVKP